MRDELCEAVVKDHGKAAFITEFTDIGPCRLDAQFALDHIDEWMEDTLLDSPLLVAPCSTKVRYEPMGTVLVFGSWNYPYTVTLKPLGNAIMAGNCCVIKPSELSPTSSAAMKKFVEKYLDTSCYAVIEGGMDVAI